jgi:hypothetical protein
MRPRRRMRQTPSRRRGSTWSKLSDVDYRSAAFASSGLPSPGRQHSAPTSSQRPRRGSAPCGSPAAAPRRPAAQCEAPLPPWRFHFHLTSLFSPLKCPSISIGPRLAPAPARALRLGCSAATTYARRCPETTPLHLLVREHLETVLATVREECQTARHAAALFPRTGRSFGRKGRRFAPHCDVDGQRRRLMAQASRPPAPKQATKIRRRLTF